MLQLLGVGVDLVHIPTFTRDFEERYQLGFFSPREQVQAKQRARQKGDSIYLHYAARWAAKEAVIKAWSQALATPSMPYQEEQFPWNQVEILSDYLYRPTVVLAHLVEEKLVHSIRTSLQHETTQPQPQQTAKRASNPVIKPRFLVSLSHEQDYAVAYVALQILVAPARPEVPHTQAD